MMGVAASERAKPKSAILQLQSQSSKTFDLPKGERALSK